MDIEKLRQRKEELTTQIKSLQSEYNDVLNNIKNIEDDSALARFKSWDPHVNDCFILIYPEARSVYDSILDILIVENVDEEQTRINGTFITYKYDEYTPTLKCEKMSLHARYIESYENCANVYKCEFESIKHLLNDLVTLSVDRCNEEDFLSKLVSHCIKIVSD